MHEGTFFEESGRSRRQVGGQIKSGEMMRDIIMGLSDGLTVPFALAAGLSNTSPSVVLTAGLAEVMAGGIAMGLGGYLAAKSDSDHYIREKKRKELEIMNRPEEEAQEVEKILKEFGLQPSETRPLVNALQRSPSNWADFLMRFERGMKKPDPQRALRSGLTIASSYVLGGLVPLLPYLLIANMQLSFLVSIAVTSFALLIFGYIKGVVNGTSAIMSAIYTASAGALASSAAFAIAKCLPLPTH